MANLSAADIKKIAKSGPFAGSLRSDIFGLKINAGLKFKIGNKEHTGISFDGENLSYYLTTPQQKKVGVVRFSKVFKDKDFGGGSGSGGGAADTAITESMQCYYNSLVFNVLKGKITEKKPASDAMLFEGEKYCYTTVSLKDCIAKGPADWVENEVYIKTANKFWDWATKWRTSKVFFHRGSKFMNNVYGSRKEAHKIDKKSDKPQAPGSFNDDKWNPGDIWATTYPNESKPFDKFISSFGELNAQVLKEANDSNVLGISLKKIGTGVPAKIKTFNDNSDENQVTYSGFTYGRTGDFFQSIDIYIATSDNEIQFRDFGGSWQGEIKSTSAAGGKIGGGNVNFFVDRYFNKKIFSKSQQEILTLTADPSFPTIFYDLYKKYNNKGLKKKTLLSFEEFMTELTAKQDYTQFAASKYMGLKLLDIMHVGADKRDRNKFINSLYKYAESNTEQSSYFIKIY
jgi:hypothetical protein